MSDFVEYLNAYDFIFLSEIWANELCQLDLNGFCKPICKFRKKGREVNGTLLVFVFIFGKNFHKEYN